MDRTQSAAPVGCAPFSTQFPLGSDPQFYTYEGTVWVSVQAAGITRDKGVRTCACCTGAVVLTLISEASGSRHLFSLLIELTIWELGFRSR